MYRLLKVYNSVILKENNIELAWPVKGQCADWQGNGLDMEIQRLLMEPQNWKPIQLRFYEVAGWLIAV